MQLDGIIPPITTPFDRNGEVHYTALRQNLAKYRTAGLRGFVIAGSTGEAAMLGTQEKEKLFQAARDSAEDGLLIAGVGSESVNETLALIRHASELQYAAALVLTPHYYRAQMLRPESQLSFFRAVADSSPLPILIYNYPQITGIDLPLDVICELSEHPNIIGIKESSADLERIEKLTSTLPPTFDVLVGASGKYHESLRLGVKGGILAVANTFPRLALLVHERYRSGDVSGSDILQKKIAEAANIAPRFGIQGLKYAMDLNGYFGGECRLPLLPPDEQTKSEIERICCRVSDNVAAPSSKASVRERLGT
ncbi:MAG TPA: dihydrodipicolinate synthase family protein [Acidobacteriaceae bacterium]|nr:dihydrodipicolinate synthase family protein [Acidobacteriaceae bacterium]